MGLVTLLFLAAFTALYFSKSMDNKPELLVGLVDKITSRLDQVAMWGVVYGAVAAVLTLLVRYSSVDMLIRLASNVLIVLMALPFVFDKLVAKYREKINVAILDEAEKVVVWTRKQERIIGYIGAACSILLFVILFR